MATRKKNIHRGQLLKAAVELQKANRELIARKAGYARPTYYKHIEDKNLPFHILAAYGRALGHDFSEDLPEMPKYLAGEHQGDYGDKPTLEEAIQQRDAWRDKYYALMEKYYKLVEEKMRR